MSIPPDDLAPTAEDLPPGALPEFPNEPPERQEREQRQDTRVLTVLKWALPVLISLFTIFALTVQLTENLSFWMRTGIAVATTLGAWLAFILIRRRIRHRKLWASRELPPPIKPSRFALEYGKLEEHEIDRVYYERSPAVAWLLVAAISPPALKDQPTPKRLKLLLRGFLVHLLVLAVATALFLFVDHPATTGALIGVTVLYGLFLSVIFWFWIRHRRVITILGPKEFTRFAPIGGNSYEPEIASNYTVVKDNQSWFEWLTRSATVSVESKDQEGPVAVYRWVADHERFAAVLRAITVIAHKGTEHDTTEARV